MIISYLLWGLAIDCKVYSCGEHIMISVLPSNYDVQLRLWYLVVCECVSVQIVITLTATSFISESNMQGGRLLYMTCSMVVTHKKALIKRYGTVFLMARLDISVGGRHNKI